MFQILKNTKFDFIGKRYIAFAISAFLVGNGIFSLVKIYNGTADLGIDFAGGTLVSVKFITKPVEVVEIREVLKTNNLSDKSVQKVNAGSMKDENKFLIRVKRGEIEIGKAFDKMTEIFKNGFPNNEFVIDKCQEIGPAVGASLQTQTLWAVFWAMLGIIIYLWWRFEFRFSVAAAIATLHDVFAMLGIVVLMNKEFTLLIVTALLTIAGYSLTDTVVVFDRIRANSKTRGKDETYERCVNRSINEVLSRTIITSTTTLLPLLALFFLGGEVIHDFVFTLFIGIIVGTYSSVFVASPIIVEWNLRSPLKGPGSRR